MSACLCSGTELKSTGYRARRRRAICMKPFSRPLLDEVSGYGTARNNIMLFEAAGLSECGACGRMCLRGKRDTKPDSQAVAEQASQGSSGPLDHERTRRLLWVCLRLVLVSTSATLSLLEIIFRLCRRQHRVLQKGHARLTRRGRNPGRILVRVRLLRSQASNSNGGGPGRRRGRAVSGIHP